MATKSQFKHALRGLLYETGLFTKSQWATYLGVSESQINGWVRGQSFPRLEYLRMILDVLENSER